MEPILFLVHRIPFPPNKGDKIRSHHWLRRLAKNYCVHLATFIEEPVDDDYASELDTLCASHCVVQLSPRLAKLRCVAGFFTGEPLTVPYYRSAELRRWVEAAVVKNNIRKAVVFSGAMAQYVERLPGLHVVLDLVDVDSAKWTQYAERRAWPLSFIYRREGEKLLAFERIAAARAAATVFVTRGEADLFTRLAPECADRLQVIENGVDTGYFAPSDNHASPYAANEAAIVFTGAMDYWPNIDAVVWFAREVLPRLVRQKPEARFYIVGMSPSKSVSALAADPHVVVTGKVPDVRPYLQHAAAVVAPLRVARGIQNKVLEAMAMGRPVVVSSDAADGVSATRGIDFETAADAEEFCRKVLMVMRQETARPMGERARARVVSAYSWERNLSALKKLLEPDASGTSDTAMSMPLDSALERTAHR
ncbi:MAG: TIGR03087 family PEP-CTERM/XrtA system glycosyltransferase [Pseudomonadota bacterium]|nr:TIGR03087 family PEP-CTERM/XrtA system glycosyltransferase [Pseudomonadota bacterium]